MDYFAHYRYMSKKDFIVGYGLYAWKSKNPKRYLPGENILFNTPIAQVGEEIICDTDVVVNSDGLYRITWFLNCVETAINPQSRFDGIARAKVNGEPLDQSYTFNILSVNGDQPAIDGLKGKHAVRLSKGDRVTVEVHPKSIPIKITQDFGKDIIGAWIEVEKVAP